MAPSAPSRFPLFPDLQTFDLKTLPHLTSPALRSPTGEVGSLGTSPFPSRPISSNTYPLAFPNLITHTDPESESPLATKGGSMPT